MTVISGLAEWVSGLEYDHLPERVRDKARLQLLSVVAAIHASARHEIGRKVLAAVDSWAGDGPCTIIPTGRKADLLSAVWANAALSVALDYDDYLLFGHTGHSAVAVSLALAEREKQSLPLALVAQVAANEIEGRMGAAVSLGPHNGQGWSHIHLAGAAAAAAKLLGLSAEQTAHALAIALYQPTYVLWPGFMGPDSKATTAATPTVTGVQAALLAAAGATGPLDVIEHPQGFLARFSYVPQPWFFSGLGRAWVTDTLAYKIYPGCAYIDTAVDATLALAREFEEDNGRRLDPGEVDSVLVEATILTVEMDHLSRTGGTFDPLNPVSLNFSIPGNIALALMNGGLAADDFDPARIAARKDEMLALASRVTLKHDWGLTVRFLEALDETLGLDDLMAGLKLSDAVKMRQRAQDQYGSSLGFTLGDLRQAWASAPNARARVWRSLKDRVGRGRPGPRGFDLGLCRLENFRMPFAARVTISINGGRRLTRTQEVPLAGPGRPAEETRELVGAKFEREAGVKLAGKQIKSMRKALPELENKLTVGKLIDLCCSRE